MTNGEHDQLERDQRAPCRKCAGRGWVADALTLGGSKDCPACGGSGFTLEDETNRGGETRAWYSGRDR